MQRVRKEREGKRKRKITSQETGKEGKREEAIEKKKSMAYKEGKRKMEQIKK